MFIYEFSSGIVETLAGDEAEAAEAEEDFDPHKARKVHKPTTYSDTMMHLLKGSIGAGVLAMPDACKRVGVLYGVIGILSIGIFATYCLNLLILAQYQICKRQKRGYVAYPKTMLLAIRDGPKFFRWTGRLFYFMVDGLLVTWQLGVCAVYFVFVSENIKQVLEHYGIHISVRLLIVILLPMQVAINLIKDLKLLTPVSSISNGITIIGMVLVFFYLVEDDVVVTEDSIKLKNLIDIPVFIGITLFALEAVGVVLALEYNMEHPHQFTGLCGLLSVGMVIILGLFVMLGAAGFLKYGDDCKASITLNLPEDQKKAQAAKLFFATALFLSFPLQNFVAYQILWRRIQKKMKPANPCIWDYSLRVVLVLIPFFLSVAAPNLGGFIALLGALCLSMVAIVFPAILDACIWYPNNYGFLHYRLIRDICIIIFGVFATVSGVYTSLLEIAESE